ncbi:iron ABC transporter [Streptomyces antioxidans]|uniref:Iron ABC transporter n=1 Tax=Streptomyces antioxidans TaxID=1507734 RepID=A0A1V4D0J3_9ACTN|nr:iron chelate uptake ABC transporter family permease subunit [Streptomyces antioxidans]OPF76017.1 iron ABC transporter [Streptomyces antioxidans]
MSGTLRPAPTPLPSAATARVRAVRRRGRVRYVGVGTGLCAAALIALCVSLSYGDYTVPLPDVVTTLLGGGDAGSRFIILELRLPRALLALLIGCCFGLSGAVFQTLLRNPLASPDIIGVGSGAGAAVVLAGGLAGLSGTPLSFVALAGALATGAAVYLLAWRKGVTGYRLVLIGLGVGTGLSSVISYQMTRSDVTEAQTAFLWLTGSINGRSWPHFWPLLVAAALLVPLTAAAARALPALQLGDDTAGGLGSRVERDRLALLGCATGLAGVATAAAGPIGFVAFVSPPIARRLVPGQGAALMPSALTGAVLVSVADFAGQHVLPGTQLPVGIVTSVVGAPYLLWLLARANRVGKGG